MSDHSKVFEITVAGIGIAVTAILGWGQFQISNEQIRLSRDQQDAEKVRAADNVEVQMISAIASHLPNLAKSGTEFEVSQKVVLAASEYLTEKYKRTSLAAMAATISKGNTALTGEVNTRIQEATQPVSRESKWFAVLASIPASDEASARNIANQKLKQLKGSGQSHPVHLYKTKISNNFAIVVGGPVEREVALDLATTARSSNLAKDAFAQQNREWTLIGAAPFVN